MKILTILELMSKIRGDSGFLYVYLYFAWKRDRELLGECFGVIGDFYWNSICGTAIAIVLCIISSHFYVIFLFLTSIWRPNRRQKTETNVKKRQFVVLLKKTKKSLDTWCIKAFLWLRGWDLNLTTSGLWARRATRLLYPAISGNQGGAGNGNRTRTVLSYHGILSPGRLPISPPRRNLHRHACGPLLIAWIVYHTICILSTPFCEKILTFFDLDSTIYVSTIIILRKIWNYAEKI